MQEIRTIDQSAVLKDKAVQRYIDERVKLHDQVIQGVSENPDWLEDKAFSAQSVKSSVLSYKLAMYRLGIKPIDILAGVKGLVKNARRGGALKAVNVGLGALKARSIPLEISDPDIAVKPMISYDRRPTAADSLEEILRSKPS